MSKLVIKKYHKSFSENDLNPDEEFYIGRGEDNGVVLDDPQISRKHLKIFYSQNCWKVECLSSLGGLIFEGEEVQSFDLNPGDTFHLKDYTFEWMKIPEKPLEEPKLNLESSGEKKTHPSTTHTAIEQNELAPYLIIALSQDEKEKSVLLKGNKWSVGRDSRNDICIEDFDVSRQHFEIAKKGAQFFITDLGSSNCTQLENKTLQPHEPHLLNSGDLIKIVDIEIYFEIRNPQIEKKIDSLMTPAAPPRVMPPPGESPGEIPIPLDNAPPEGPLMVPPNVIANETMVGTLPSPPGKKRKFFIFGILLLIGAVVFFMMDEVSEDDETLDQNVEIGSDFDKLSPEKKEQVKSIYSTAQRLYNQQKFSTCEQKLNALHEIIPFYEQSQNLLETCQAGAESLKEAEDIKRRKAENKKSEEFVKNNVKECKGKFNSFSSLEALQNCLSKSIELDPSHEEINQLIEEYETKEFLKKQRSEQALENRRREQKSRKAYESIQSIKEKGSILKAIKSYKNFLNKKHPQGVAEIVDQARKELQDMEQDVQTRTEQAMEKCENHIESKLFKDAHQSCSEVLSVSPGNTTALKWIKMARESIQNELKPLYEQSVLVESIGQVDQAKKIWNQILERDIPNGYYAAKAQSKLSKY